MSLTREEALASKGRYGTVPQHPPYQSPVWTGQVVDVHSSGDYVQFKRRSSLKAKWYHRNDVTLHPLQATEGAPAPLPPGTTA